MLGERATPEKRAELTAVLGLDQPIFVQYFKLPRPGAAGQLRAVDRGRRRVLGAVDVFFSRFGATIELAIGAMIFAPGARHPARLPRGQAPRRRPGQQPRSSFSLIGIAVPVFFLAFLLKYVFAVKWGLLPPSGRQTPGHRRHQGDRAFHPRRGHHPGVGRRLGRRPAPDPAVDRARHHPVRGDLPDHPGVGARGAGRGLRPDRRGEGPDQHDHPEPARPAQRDAAGDHRDRPADRCAAGRRRAHRDGLRLPGHR